MFSFFKKKKVIVTHGGGYHADDVFACAALSLLYNDRIKILRSRDPEIIARGDIVLDVGGEYDPARGRFDHHQIGGAGIRPNGIPYASFGLIWKEFGEQIGGSRYVQEVIENKLVLSIDANDNGIDISKDIYEGISKYSINSVIAIFLPTWKEAGMNLEDKAFIKAVGLAKMILSSEIKQAQEEIEKQEFIDRTYEQSSDKKVVLFDEYISRHDINHCLKDKSDVVYVIVPRHDKTQWSIHAIRVVPWEFASRKPFPKAWAGLRDADLSRVSGVPDAVFCHNSRFLVTVVSKESAMKLAQSALESKDF